ncbi:MAG TPA: outer membrane beta-barrel protein [Gemmatimonadaceae bacterium]|nr:outer membrane beta-barrel protein [Gemmatimonadaceae bacterium]
MFRHGVYLAAASLALTAVATGANAQQHKIRVGFGGGMSVPVSDAGDAFKSGFNGKGFLLVNLGGLPSLRIDLGYQKFDYKQEFQNPLGSDATDATSQILSGVAGLHIDLIRVGPVRPYLLAGLGAFNVRSSLDSLGNDTGTVSQTKFGIDGGAGVAFTLGKRLDAFVEAKVQNIYTDQGVIDTKSIRVIPITFGIMF